MKASRVVKTLQLIGLGFALILSVALGLLFQYGFEQGAIFAAENRDCPPLPKGTAFLFENQRLIGYMFAFPWVCLVVMPFWARTTPYFRTDFYLIRYLLFLTAQFFLFLAFGLLLALPFVPHYLTGVETREMTEPEWVGIFLFWTVLLGSLFVGLLRVLRRKRIEKGE